jgi:NDP-sugar pyrophosphorylase family protein
MKAMILAAGLGTRLGELTSDTPKALVKIQGISMLERLVRRLKKQGISEFLINIHHFGDQIIDFTKKHNNFGVKISFSDERDELLDTGGALLKAAGFFTGNEPILVHNVDVYSEFRLKQLIDYHHNREAMVTFCMRKRTMGRVLIVDQLYQLIGWGNLDQINFRWVSQPTMLFQTFAFEGIYLLSPDFVNKIPFSGKFSIIDCWLEMAKTEKIIGFRDESPIWFDLGSAEKIVMAEKYFREKKLSR